MQPIKIALIGAGKIARDQHVPALSDSDAFELVAAASPHERLLGVRHYSDLEALLEGVPEVNAVAICTPPQVRFQIARRALEHGCHVLLEKPPAGTLSEVNALMSFSEQQRLALFATWHSRQASGVEPARNWLAQRRIKQVNVQWKEDVREWHPGQAWIWKAGGLGVFDPGINALSILTRILPGSLLMQDAELKIPANCETPIAAKVQLSNEDGIKVLVELDFLHTGAPMWDIDIETDAGHLQLAKGGAVLRIDGAMTVNAHDVEYRNLYAHFATLISARRVDVDVAPFALAIDALLRGRRIEVAPFVE